MILKQSKKMRSIVSILQISKPSIKNERLFNEKAKTSVTNHKKRWKTKVIFEMKRIKIKEYDVFWALEWIKI